MNAQVKKVNLGSRLLIVMVLLTFSRFASAMESDAGEIVVVQRPVVKKEPMKWIFGNHTLELAARLRIEGFYSKNATLLNDLNCGLDKMIIPAKHTFDIGTIYGYGCASHGYNVIQWKTTLRNKNVWGSPETNGGTGEATIKDKDVVFGKHTHAIHRHLLWIREMWLEMVLNDMFDLRTVGQHTFTLGFFPFQLGRGIALGDAYATDPDFLGYYSAAAIDQYAPGFKFAGMFDKDKRLSYDLYLAILNNKSSTFNDVNMKIRGQEYGQRYFQARGFGSLNWLFAARLRWFPVRNEAFTLMIEPYGLYNDEREQRLEFVGDASSKMGTFGCALEANIGRFDCGFDLAGNIGGQTVKGWDRNTIEKEVRNGTFVEVNSDVYASSGATAPDVAGSKALFLSANQAIIANSVESQSMNGKAISTGLTNSADRFNDPYRNKFSGFMTVGDMSYRFCKELKMSVGGGLATGDLNPNRDIEQINDSNKDTTYTGFIGLQETYSGTRIRSAFLLSGAGRIPRIVAFPSPNVTDRTPETVSRFTNIIFAGWSANIKAGKCNLNPNIMNFWQDYPTRFFDVTAEKSSDVRCARTWLGLELNLFADYSFDNDIKLFLVAAGFIPGSYYSDVKGRPLSKEQQRFLDSLDRTGVTADFVPTLGNNFAYTFNLGLEYRF